MAYAPIVHAALAFVLAAYPPGPGPLIRQADAPWLSSPRMASTLYAGSPPLQSPKAPPRPKPANEPDSETVVPLPSASSAEADPAPEAGTEASSPAPAPRPSDGAASSSARETPASADDAPNRGKASPSADAPLPDDLLAPAAETSPAPRSAASLPATPTRPSDRPGFLPGNPVRAQVVVRALFANVGLGTDPGPGGRMGGVRADACMSWNFVAVGAQVLAFGGLVEREDGRYTRAILGGGPVVSLGRLAMVGRGVVDLRAGYAFGWAPVRDGDGGRASSAPHGPSLVLDLAIVARTARAQAIHAGGISLFYQGWVHDLAGQLPAAHMLGAGLTYWFD